MWANSFWGFLSLGVAFVLARLSMIGTSGYEVWAPRLCCAATICFVLSAAILFWPPFVRRLPSRLLKRFAILRVAAPELRINVGKEAPYVETANTGQGRITKTLSVGVKNAGGTYLSNCKLVCKTIDIESNQMKDWMLANSFSLQKNEDKYVCLAFHTVALVQGVVTQNYVQASPGASGGGNFWRPPAIGNGSIVTLIATSAESAPCEINFRLVATDVDCYLEIA